MRSGLADALSRAEKLDREIEGRRGEMFGDLERQRDDLTAAVSALRNFETPHQPHHPFAQADRDTGVRPSRADRDLRSTENNSNGTAVDQGEHGGIEQPQREMLQASAEVVPAIPHASTLFWGTSAELLALINTTGPLRRALWCCESTLEIQGEISAGR